MIEEKAYEFRLSAMIGRLQRKIYGGDLSQNSLPVGSTWYASMFLISTPAFCVVVPTGVPIMIVSTVSVSASRLIVCY